jgi:predicted Zn-dependent protease
VEDALAGLERAMGDIAEQQRREAAEADRRAEAEGQRRRRAIAAQATAARHAMNEGDFQDAIETLEHALRREPDSPELAALLLEARAGLAAGLQ